MILTFGKYKKSVKKKKIKNKRENITWYHEILRNGTCSLLFLLYLKVQTLNGYDVFEIE